MCCCFPPQKGFVPVSSAVQAQCSHRESTWTETVHVQMIIIDHCCSTGVWANLEHFLLIKQWLKLTSDDVKEQIFKLAKKGLTPSQIGKTSVRGKMKFIVITRLLACRWTVMLMSFVRLIFFINDKLSVYKHSELQSLSMNESRYFNSKCFLIKQSL